MELAVAERSPQKPCVEPPKLSHPMATLTQRNQRRLWSDVLVSHFWGEEEREQVGLVDRFALGKVSRNGFLSLDYMFSKVAKNWDLHRIKAGVYLEIFSFLFLYPVTTVTRLLRIVDFSEANFDFIISNCCRWQEPLSLCALVFHVQMNKPPAALLLSLHLHDHLSPEVAHSFPLPGEDWRI